MFSRLTFAFLLIFNLFSTSSFAIVEPIPDEDVEFQNIELLGSRNNLSLNQKLKGDIRELLQKINEKGSADTEFKANDELSDKSWLVAFLLCFFLGYLGIHRFYLGYTGIGIIQLLTFGGFGIWWFIDFILILTGGLKAKGGKKLKP